LIRLGKPIENGKNVDVEDPLAQGVRRNARDVALARGVLKTTCSALFAARADTVIDRIAAQTTTTFFIAGAISSSRRFSYLPAYSELRNAKS
jgi:hypothetical protein